MREQGEIKGGGERNGKEIKEITREEGRGMKEQRDERVYKTKKNFQKGDKRSKRREAVQDGRKVERKTGWKKRGKSVECRGEQII